MRRSTIGRAVLVLPAAGLALASGFTPAQASGTTGWRTVATISEPSFSGGLTSVAAAGDKGSWAVGYAGSSKGDTFTPIVESWNGVSWGPVTVPTAQLTKLGELPLLDTVATSGPGNVWAFTAFGGWLHGTTNGTTWTAGRISKKPVVVQSSLALGQDTGWVFGGSAGPKGTTTPYAAYNTSSGWKRTAVPGNGTISAASAISPGNIWAALGAGSVGLGSSAGGLVHWSGGHWHAVANLPAELRKGSLGSVLARSDKNVWVGGAVKNSKGGTTEALGHWNGHDWKVTVLRAAASKSKFYVSSIVTDGAGGLWALGSCDSTGCPNAGLASRLWHQTKGSWSRPIVPKLATSGSALLDLAPVGRSVWGVGAVRVGKKGANGLIAVWGATP
jgi:hypothetical protein